jgi:glycosyl-4,4'-diaponeurosporenoate acyltransferase
MASPPLLPLLSSAAFWLLASLLVGQGANLVPARWFLPHVPPAASSAGRSRGRPAGPPGIRVWKRWIPDAGPSLPGGVRKANLARRDPGALRRLWVETGRAELVHGLLWAAGGLTALWLPPEGVLVNLVFATAFNLPCLLVQRFNRDRLRRCLGRMGTG